MFSALQDNESSFISPIVVCRCLTHHTLQVLLPQPCIVSLFAVVTWSINLSPIITLTLSSARSLILCQFNGSVRVCSGGRGPSRRVEASDEYRSVGTIALSASPYCLPLSPSSHCSTTEKPRAWPSCCRRGTRSASHMCHSGGTIRQRS